MVKVLAVGPSELPITGQSYAFQKVLEIAGVERVIRNSTSASARRAALFYLNYLVSLIFVSHRFDVCYFTCSRTRFGFWVRDFPLFVAMRLRKVPMVAHLHGADFKAFRCRLTSFERFLFDLCYAGLSKAIVLLPEMKREFSDYPSMDVSVTPNFYERNFHDSKVPRKPDEDIGALNLLFLSNLIPEKGYRELIEAVRRLHCDGFSVHLTIAGGGSNEAISEVIDDARESGGLVDYVGVVSGLDKENLLMVSDVVCLPSYYQTEALPICLIEGMAFGCAVLATNHNYLPSMVPADRGYLVQPKSISGLVEALKEIALDSEALSRIQSNNKLYAEKHYSPAAYLTSVSGIFESYASASKRASV